MFYMIEYVIGEDYNFVFLNYLDTSSKKYFNPVITILVRMTLLKKVVFWKR